MEKKNINCELDEFMTHVDGLRNLVRYQTAPRAARETVAEHSFFVAAYVLKLNDYYRFDLEKALKMAILHDFSEVFISDVPHPIKARFKTLKEELDKAEFQVNSDYISEEFAYNLGEFNNLTSIEGIVVALADILSVVAYSKFEMELGNSKYMQRVFVRSRERYFDLLVKAEPYLRKDSNGDGKKTTEIINLIENFMVADKD